MEHVNFDNKNKMPSSLSNKQNRKYFADFPISSLILKQQKSEKIKAEDKNTNENNTFYLNTYCNEDNTSNLYLKKKQIDFKDENDFDNDYNIQNHKKIIQEIKDKKHKNQFVTSLSPLLKTFQKDSNNLNFYNLENIWNETNKKNKTNYQNNSPKSDSTLSRNCSPFSPFEISPSSSGIESSINTSATTISEQNANQTSSSLFSPIFNFSNLLQIAKSLNGDLSLLENNQSVINHINNPLSDNNKKKIKFSIEDILQSNESDFNKIPKDVYNLSYIKNLYPTEKMSSLLTFKIDNLVPSTSVSTLAFPKLSNLFHSFPNQLTKNSNEILSKSTNTLIDTNRFPAWIFCTRYSDRPSSGSRTRKTKRKPTIDGTNVALKAINNKTIVDKVITIEDEKRPRTAFTVEQLDRLKQQFIDSRYLTEKRRQELAHELGLNESQIKIWFQNKRAKLKKNANAVITIADAQPPKIPVNATTNSSIAAFQLMQNLYQSSQSQI